MVKKRPSRSSFLVTFQAYSLSHGFAKDFDHGCRKTIFAERISVAASAIFTIAIRRDKA